GQLQAAIFFGKQAVNVVQRMRESIAPLAVNERKSFVAHRERVYRDLADWLITSGRLHETEEVLDLLKLEELSQYTNELEPTEGRRTIRAAMVRQEVSAARELEQLIHDATGESSLARSASGQLTRHSQFAAGLQRIVQSLNRETGGGPALGEMES